MRIPSNTSVLISPIRFASSLTTLREKAAAADAQSFRNEVDRALSTFDKPMCKDWKGQPLTGLNLLLLINSEKRSIHDLRLSELQQLFPADQKSEVSRAVKQLHQAGLLYCTDGSCFTWSGLLGDGLGGLVDHYTATAPALALGYATVVPSSFGESVISGALKSGKFENYNLSHLYEQKRNYLQTVEYPQRYKALKPILEKLVFSQEGESVTGATVLNRLAMVQKDFNRNWSCDKNPRTQDLYALFSVSQHYDVSQIVKKLAKKGAVEITPAFTGLSYHPEQFRLSGFGHFALEQIGDKL